MASKKSQSINVSVEEWLEDDMLALLSGMARDGYTYQDIANRIGISQGTLIRWRREYPEINQALRQGREIVDYKVENALLKSALGYKTKEVEVITTLRGGVVVEQQRRTLTKEQPPNVSAIQVWLYNRLPDKWKKNRDNLITPDEDDMTIQVTVTRAGEETEQETESHSNAMNSQIEVRRATEDEIKAKKDQKRSDDENKESMSTKIEFDDSDDDWSDVIEEWG